MAAISKALGASLDSLRSVIIEAETFLSKSPGGGASIVIPELSEFPHQRTMYYDEITEHLVLCWVDELPDARELVVSELPVAARIIAAKHIPELIQRANERTELLAPEIDEIVKSIQKAMKN